MSDRKLFFSPKIDDSLHRGRLVSGRVNFPIRSEFDASEERKVSDSQVYVSHTADVESISEVFATRIDSENFEGRRSMATADLPKFQKHRTFRFLVRFSKLNC
ncbi:hypothetical protein AVEN_48462-1 [Araneus ventricosus]|uniref:Uncharacterized protein n=1 Tax=Araneus ventricosus TaxID=182803 RepID=A0A4Y2K311_ARAVE|nr:hypothetical protein AVEN_239231-1 [Araneus ventricosus]GBM96567.1 hypothetical protein AVEN_48462-1 [Araneus ventricosus]